MMQAKGQCSFFKNKITNLIEIQMIQWIYKRTVEILVWVQTILISVKMARQAVRHGARHEKWKLKQMPLCFRLLSPSTMLVLPRVAMCRGRSVTGTAHRVLLAVKVPQLGCSKAANDHDTVSPNSFLWVGTSI